MFGEEFYPTPDSLIWDMLSKFWEIGTWNKKINILEPSAGKWDILDKISKMSWFNREHTKLFAIEQDPNLQAILKNKWYTLIDTDFLSYQDNLSFDLIIMNPPFSNGDDHFLKAWEIANDTTIVCLLNAETIRNPYSKSRQLVAKIIEDNNWTVEYYQNAFVSAERSTSVEVALITVKKISSYSKFEFSGFETEKININEDIINNDIATRDVINNLITSYNQSCSLFLEGMKMIEKSQSIIDSITESDYSRRIFEIATEWWSIKDRYTTFIESIKYSIWRKIANELNISKYMTSRLQNDFNTFIKEQWSLSITYNNIRQFADMIVNNRRSILDNMIVEAFDKFTKHHYDNREFVEWWKTNDKWKVNKKIILPNMVSFDSWGWNTKYSIYELDDIDKALCYIEWIDYCTIIPTSTRVKDSFKLTPGSAESLFFDIKYFKKGSMHLTWKDEELRKEFNMRACAWKQWLPPKEEDEWKKSKQQKSTAVTIF